MERSTFAPPPQRFEAGVPMIAQAVGLGAAVDYLTRRRHGRRRGARARAHRRTRSSGLAEVPGVRIVGPTDTDRAGARCPSSSTASTRTTSARCSTTRASRSGSATTAPGRCTAAFGVPATTRATFYLYNDRADVDALVAAVRHAQDVLRGERDELESMYQEIILDHYRDPHGTGLREPYDAEVHHVNPTCGDEIDRCGVRLDERRGGRGRLLRRSGLLDQPGQRLGDDRAASSAGPSTRRWRCSRSSSRSCRAGARSSPTRRCSRTRRVRRRGEVPGAGQVRAARLDGMEGRGHDRDDCEGDA